MTIQQILWYALALVVGVVTWYFGYKMTLTQKEKQFNKKMENAKEIEEDLIEKAKWKADKIIEHAEEKADKIEEQRTKKIEEIQNRLMTREEKMDERLEKLEVEKTKIQEKRKEADDLVKKQNKKLEEVAKLSIEDAKEELFSNIKIQEEKEISIFIDKFKTIKKEEADTEAVKIISKAIPRVASETVSEFTSNLVDIPNEDYKGKLIGREWRNISYFEKTTWVELIIDDTPLVVRVSSFDHEKRFLAKRTLEALLKDGRINPHYIEKTYNQMVTDLDTILLEKGKEALNKLNLTMMKPELVKAIWQFSLRYSYGQNLWLHSIEVAKICEAIATELGMDPILAKKAGLLHDIGKIIATTGQSHAQLWADFLRKQGVKEEIINAAESHHYDVPMTSPYSRIVAAADAMSASRPWARHNTKDLFIEKMSELEKLISTVTWVQKVHIMQAWREIMVYIDPDKIGDLEVEKLLKTIWEKIETQLDYPGIIRITAIRERKIIQHLR